MHEQRGATLAEYALLVGLVAIVCVGAVTLLGHRSRATVDEVASRVDSGHRDAGSTPTDGTGDGGGGVTPTSTTTVTSTTISTTTTAPTTSTTAPATTTTLAGGPAPAVPGPEFPADSGFVPPEQVIEGLDWHLDTALVLRSDDGSPLRSTDATVEIWRHVYTTYGWRWVRSLVPVTTGADGTTPFATPAYRAWGSNAVDRLVVTIIDVDDASWDGVRGTLDVSI